MATAETDPHAAHLAAAATPDIRARLEAIQREVERLLPEAQRCEGYRMAAYRGRKVFLYFAPFKKHIGVYPPLCHDAALVAELGPYRNEKGNLAFPLAEPLPIELIGRVAVALHKEIHHA